MRNQLAEVVSLRNQLVEYEISLSFIRKFMLCETNCAV